MDWLTSGLQAAQQAASSLMSSEAAEKARLLAQEASRQALAIAQEATSKAQEVAKEVAKEAEKGLTSALGAGSAERSAAADPLVYGVTAELQQFVSSLTYVTFSDFPMETLPTPEEAGGAPRRLTPWQETHARLVLERVPQLQDLRFVLCPRALDEHDFWMIYFTLCRRYLPKSAFEEHGAAAAPSTSGSAGQPAGASAGAGQTSSPGLPPSKSAGGLAAAAAAAAAGAGGAAAGLGSLSGGAAAASAAAAGEAGGTGAAVARGSDGAGSGGGAGGSDALGDLAADPELEAYLEDALAIGGTEDGAGSDEGDLDDYINALEDEVNEAE